MMKTINRLAIIGLTGAVVAACSSIDLNMTKKMSLSGDAFQRALFTEYVDLARMEDEEGDGKDAVYFNNRAIGAANGKDTGPQALKERSLPKTAAPNLAAARESLVSALANATKSNPAQAARAQAMFDCWMQEQEENDQPPHIARCRSAFETALQNISGAKPAPKPVAKAKKKKKAPAKEFIIMFGFDSAKVDHIGMSTVGDIKLYFKTGKKIVVLTGHTDTSGERGYNQALSEQRVDAVKEALAFVGIGDANLVTQYFGEDDPAKMTGDGVKSAPNRRVTVKVK